MTPSPASPPAPDTGSAPETPSAGTVFRRVMVTGHRPSGLTGPQGAWSQVALARTAHRLRSAYGTEVAISGMALGADTWWAVSALAAGLRLHAYIPFLDQPAKWPVADQALWTQLRHFAEHEVVVGGQSYDVRQLHARNDAMLADADLVVALYDGSSSGGTASTVKKARAKQMPMLLLDPVAGSITPERWQPAA